MADFLILPSEEDAIAKSAEAWEAHLGRKKRPEDITEFLWDYEVGKDGRAALVIDDKAELLKPAEASKTVTVLPVGKGENWEQPKMVVEGGEKGP